MAIWLGFFLAIALILTLAKTRLWLGLMAAAVVLGLFGLPIKELGRVIYATFTDPSIILLALAVGLIPVIGTAMEVTGLMDNLADNFRVNQKLFLASFPALIGMLPMPGGALLSAPVVKKGAPAIPNKMKTAINVWFRHVLILIYPLSALLVTTKMAGVNLYTAMLYLVPAFILMIVMGYFFFLRDIKGKILYASHFNFRKFSSSLGVILAAPLIHFALTTIFENLPKEAGLLIGVSTSVGLAFYLGKIKREMVKLVFVKLKPWNFALIILGVFLFLNVFKASEASRAIAAIAFTKSFLLIAIGFFVGFITGRVDVSVSIVFPIYILKYNVPAMAYSEFTLLYLSVFMGYILSPAHPCALVTLEYFQTDWGEFFRLLAPPTAIIVGISFIAALALGL